MNVAKMFLLAIAVGTVMCDLDYTKPTWTHQEISFLVLIIFFACFAVFCCFFNACHKIPPPPPGSEATTPRRDETIL